jgi:hypothetical protein
MPANVTPAITTATGRPVKSYRAPPNWGWWVDARSGKQPTERLRSLARRLNWIPNEFPTLPEFRANPRLRRIAVRKMLSDEAVKTGLLQKTFGVAQLTLKSAPKNKTKPADIQAADFVRYNIEEVLPRGTVGLVEEVGFHSLIEDHSLSEPIWPAPGVLETDDPWKGKRSLANVKCRHPDTYTIENDNHGTDVGVRYTDDEGRQIVDDPASFIIFRYLNIYSSASSGYTDLEAAYNHFSQKVDLVRMRAIFEDRAAGGFIVGKVANPADPNLKADFAAARSCGFLLLSKDSDVEVHDLAAGAHDVFRNSIEDKNQAILLALNSGYLHALESTHTNPRGDTRVHLSGMELLQWHLAASLSACFTRQLAPLIVGENFAGAGRPRLTLSAPNLDYVTAYLKNALMMKELVGGENMSMEEVYEQSGYGPPRHDGDGLPEASFAPSPTVPGAVGGGNGATGKPPGKAAAKVPPNGKPPGRGRGTDG